MFVCFLPVGLVQLVRAGNNRTAEGPACLPVQTAASAALQPVGKQVKDFRASQEHTINLISMDVSS